MKKIIKYIFIASFTLILCGIFFYKFIILPDLARIKNRPKYYINSPIGYAPFKFSVHKEWIPDKRYDYPAFRRKISRDLPRSNFTIQVQELTNITGSANVDLEQYVEEYVIKEMKEIHKAIILSNSNLVIDNFPAKTIVYKYPLTIRELTREIKGRVVILIIDGYVYSFALGTFDKDFNVANKEFELMVKSFHFTEQQ